MRRYRAILVAVVLVAAVGGTASAGSGSASSGLEKALQAQERHTDRLLSKAAVVGTAVGLTSSGEATVLVLTAGDGVRGLPRSLDGVPVTVEVTGALRALHHRPGHGGGPPGGGNGGDDGGGGGDASLSPTDRHPRPVPIGISTGNRGECSAGTIGARVKSGPNVYALSNNHVYARENKAPIGSKVLQPGLYDTGCAYDPANDLGTLAAFEPITFGGTTNTVDAAIASTTTGNLGRATPSDGYGTPSSTTQNASLGMAVLKYGRSTGQTAATVTGVNATVRVGYGSGTATFVNQLILESQKGPFLKAGDSGSLVVTGSQNRPVGLLFAGNTSGKLGVANRIADVLGAFGVTVDGA